MKQPVIVVKRQAQVPCAPTCQLSHKILGCGFAFGMRPMRSPPILEYPELWSTPVPPSDYHLFWI